METIKEFIGDVRHEIDSLKENATSEEISRLTIDGFDYGNRHNCIYGKLTGDCCSVRAKELMNKCCIRVMDAGVWGGVGHIKTAGRKRLLPLVNGSYTAQTWGGSENYDKGTYYRSYRYLSVLEGYISLPDANIEGVISYMKGEINELEL